MWKQEIFWIHIATQICLDNKDNIQGESQHWWDVLKMNSSNQVSCFRGTYGAMDPCCSSEQGKPILFLQGTGSTRH